MDSLQETHLLKLHSYLTKHCYDRNGNRAIRNDVLNRYVKVHGDFGINVEKMCSYCFSLWHEGDFSIKFKPRRTPRKNSVGMPQKKWVIKCSTCLKCTIFKYAKPKNLSPRLKSKTVCKQASNPAETRNELERQSRNNHSKTVSQKSVKNTSIKASSKNKSKHKDTRKTPLSILSDLL